MDWPDKLSFNAAIAHPRPLDEIIDAAGRAGVTGVGLHVHLVEEFGPAKVAALTRDAGLQVTFYGAIGNWVSGVDYAGRPRTHADLVRGLDDAAALGAQVVEVSPGRLDPGDRDLRSARRRFVEGVAELLPYARERNLKLGLEPVHPIAPNEPVILTLRQALDIMDEIGDDALGVIPDTYHVWWDPELVPQLKRAGDRIFMMQVADWSPGDVQRHWRLCAMMGEGCIDYRPFIECLRGYDCWWDVEATNVERLPSVSLPDLIDWVGRSFQETIGQYLK